MNCWRMRSADKHTICAALPTKMHLFHAANRTTATMVVLPQIHSRNFSGMLYSHKLIPYYQQCLMISLIFLRHRFNFDQDISIFHKLTITSRYYDTQVLPKSKTTPYLIMFYADWCFSCMKAAATFKKMQDSLEPLGIVFATVNAGLENNLVRRASVHTLPCITLVIDEKNYVYKDSVFSVQKLVDFIRQKLPYKLMLSIKDDTLDKFLSGWEDNRVRVIVMEPRTQPRLRYLISAFQFRQRVAFGYVRAIKLSNAMHH